MRYTLSRLLVLVVVPGLLLCFVPPCACLLHDDAPYDASLRVCFVFCFPLLLFFFFLSLLFLALSSAWQEKGKIFFKRKITIAQNPWQKASASRFGALFYVKNMVIKKMLPKSLLEDDDVREFFDYCCTFFMQNNSSTATGGGAESGGPADTTTAPHFPVRSLYSRKVKCHIVELYTATKTSVLNTIAEINRTSVSPPFNLTIDLWKCVVTGDKYLGVRVTWAHLDGTPSSALLGVKKYDPSTAAREEMRASDLVAAWTRACLEEYGIRTSRVICSVSDRGSDILRTLNTSLNLPWEYCLCHLINCSISYAFGLYADATKAKQANPEAFKVVSTMKKVIAKFKQSQNDQILLEEMQESQNKKKKKMQSLATTRWSSLCNVLERVLDEWNSLKGVYRQKSVVFPLQVYETEIIQMYAILKPLVVILQRAQGREHGLGASCLLDLIFFMNAVTAPGTRLPLVKNIDGEKFPENTSIAEEEVTTAAYVCKKRLYSALLKRIRDFRYSKKPNASCSHLWDAAVAMHPAFCRKPYKWIRAIQTDQEAADAAETRVEKVILNLLEKTIMDYRIAGKDTGFSLSNNEDSQSQQGKNAVPLLYRHQGQALMAFQNDDTAPEEAPGQSYLTVSEEALQWLERYRNWAQVNTKPKGLNQLDHSGAFKFWTREPPFPLLGDVARTIMSVPASAAQNERDFSSAGDLVRARRNRIDCAYVDMVLFLYFSFSAIPSFEKVPKLSVETFEEKLPVRYTDLPQFQQIRELDNFVEAAPAEIRTVEQLGDATNEEEEEAMVQALLGVTLMEEGFEAEMDFDLGETTCESSGEEVEVD